MKQKAIRYYPLFFTFCILASLIVSSYLNINFAFANSKVGFSKHTTYTSKEKASTSNDFLFEENETKSETSLDFKLWTNVLMDVVSYFQFQSTQRESFTSYFSAEKPSNPIYILVCDFRI